MAGLPDRIYTSLLHTIKQIDPEVSERFILSQTKVYLGDTAKMERLLPGALPSYASAVWVTDVRSLTAPVPMVKLRNGIFAVWKEGPSVLVYDLSMGRVKTMPFKKSATSPMPTTIRWKKSVVPAIQLAPDLTIGITSVGFRAESSGTDAATGIRNTMIQMLDGSYSTAPAPPVEPDRPAQEGAPHAPPTRATQTAWYSGPRFCTNHDCRFQGARTELLQCSDCGFQTRLINGYGGSTAVVEKPEHTKLTEVGVPSTGLPQNVAGARFCAWQECTQRGVRTQLAQCPECRFQTRLIATYGGSTQVRD